MQALTCLRKPPRLGILRGPPKAFFRRRACSAVQASPPQQHPLSRPKLLLGIESSCDDTGAAVVTSEGRVLGEDIAGQADIHAPWGGVVPNLAMEAHKAAIDRVVENALMRAGVQASQLDAVAVTVGPGLSLCLRVGVVKAMALSATHRLPLVRVHHMEAHALVARLLDAYQPARPAPTAFTPALLDHLNSGASSNSLPDPRTAHSSNGMSSESSQSSGLSMGAVPAVDSCSSECSSSSSSGSSSSSRSGEQHAAGGVLSSSRDSGSNECSSSRSGGQHAGGTAFSGGRIEEQHASGCMFSSSSSSSSSSGRDGEQSAGGSVLSSSVPFPFLCLLVSGGHNLVVLVQGVGQYVQLGTTVDDALGEAFDKVARLLSLDLKPNGGAALERLAKEGVPTQFKFKVPMRKYNNANFSFAGLKTSVRMAIDAHINNAQPSSRPGAPLTLPPCPPPTPNPPNATAPPSSVHASPVSASAHTTASSPSPNSSTAPSTSSTGATISHSAAHLAHSSPREQVACDRFRVTEEEGLQSKSRQGQAAASPPGGAAHQHSSTARAGGQQSCTAQIAGQQSCTAQAAGQQSSTAQAASSAWGTQDGVVCSQAESSSIDAENSRPITVSSSPAAVAAQPASSSLQTEDGRPSTSGRDPLHQVKADIAASFQHVATVHLVEKLGCAIQWAKESDPGLRWV
ncbi:glycoprotease family-domain-containing protein [Dunaliella salina]|uniref:N(6)-L-threonylcarbamoyladenine synthase n=1 Tax=Dunaliella salina TaxID=3046 RepID=A0ABQ7GWS5_DUNSA|nr:glycoprotease family-domain-containing protein [Dunaliella salina]|eukprot:KAF5839064.1 glycoprotease family-domain-containing protein [Dunaliella salina]